MSQHLSTELAAFILTGLVWGATNPFIQRGATYAHRNGRSLLSTKSYLVPQGINLCASLAFTLLSAGSRISRAAPITNAVTLAATTIVGVLLGDPIRSKFLATLGLLCVIAGTYLCTN